MSDNVANIPSGDVRVETAKLKKSSYTVEVSRFENGKFNPIRIPCEIVQENATSCRVRVKFSNGDVRIIRKNRSKIFSDQLKNKVPKEGTKKEKTDEKMEKMSNKNSMKKKIDSTSITERSGGMRKSKRNGRILKS